MGLFGVKNREAAEQVMDDVVKFVLFLCVVVLLLVGAAAFLVIRALLI